MTARYPLVLNGTNIQELQTGDTVAGLAESGANSDITSLTGLTTALSVAQGGTGVTTSTGTGNVVLSTSPSLVTPILGTPTSGTLTNCTGYTFTNIASKPTTLSGYGITDAILSSTIGAASGIAPLGSDSKIASTYLPSYVDDVLEYANLAGFPGTGETAKIYVALDTNKIYRWSGSAYIEIGPTDGNSDTATKLATARSISTTGDATWTVSFDGSANATAAITLASVVTAATGTKVTYNAKGLITGSTTLTVSDITDIATNYQAKHANLTAVAGLSTATTGLIKFTNGVASFDSNTYVISGGALGTPSSGTLTNCTFPTLNQNTTGTAAGLSATLAIASGGTGATSASAALTALGAQAALVSGTSIKTVNGTTLLGSGDLVITGGGGASATKTIANKTAAYTVVAGDLGKIINCTANTFTVSLTAAATLGAGFTCTIWNTSNTYTDVITIDPNLAETIDSIATLTLQRGEGLDIVCDGTGWQVDNKKPMRMYAENLSVYWARPVCSGNGAIAIGEASSSSGLESYAFGYGANASGQEALAIGTRANAASNFSTAIGENSTQQGSKAVTGAGAMALGGSYASGVDSFAAAIGNNTSSYGAQGTNSIAMGYLALGGSRTLSFGYNSLASGNYSSAIGYSATSSGFGTSAFGYFSTASGTYSTAIGANSAGSGSQAVTGSGAMALGGSYASGTDSFAAAIADNTSTYGATGLSSIAIGYQAVMSNTYGLAIGYKASATGYGDTVLGNLAIASGLYSTSIGYNTSAVSNLTCAIGNNSAYGGSYAISGAGAMALGGSYASGADSFAAAIGNNTSSYGATGASSIAIGYQAKATSSNSKAIGNTAVASHSGALAISTGDGTFGATTSGAYSIGIGRSVTVSGQLSTGLGQGTVSGNYSVGIGFAYSVTADMGVALGAYANTSGIIGKISFGSANGYGGAALTGKTTVSAATTTTTTVVLTTDAAAATTTNQLIVATGQAMTFFGTLIAKQSASANMASYLIKGSIVNNAGTVSISSIAIETIVDTIGLTTQPTFTADNTNKALTVTSGAKATTNIRWVCNLDSVEVTYA